MKNKLMYDTTEGLIKFDLVEDKDATEVDGVHILAKVVGQFFVPDGKSRNGRYYPKALWEKVISDVKIKSKLDARMMYGTVGHKKSLDDEALGEGEGSHFMTKMWIDEEGRGMGECYVVGTPRGKILNTMLRAGSMFAVSSRADGTFKGKKGGMPVVNEDTYAFYNFDFVSDPGFLDAKPELVEAHEKLEKLEELDNNIKSNKTGENKMSEKLVEHISNENHELKKKLVNLTDEVTASNESNVALKEENNHIKSEMEKCEGDKSIIEGFSKLGTVEEITEKLGKLEEADTKIAKFEELGDTVEEIKEALEKSVAFSESVSEMGTVEEIKEALEETVSIKAALDEMGTVEEIKEALELYSKELDEKAATELAESTKVLAEEIGLEIEKVEELLKKYSAEDIKALHSKVSKNEENEESSEEGSKFVKKNFNEEKEPTEEEVKTAISESSLLGSTRAERIASRV